LIIFWARGATEIEHALLSNFAAPDADEHGDHGEPG
jgi:hypothetical protein